MFFSKAKTYSNTIIYVVSNYYGSDHVTFSKLGMVYHRMFSLTGIYHYISGIDGSPHPRITRTFPPASRKKNCFTRGNVIVVFGVIIAATFLGHLKNWMLKTVNNHFQLSLVASCYSNGR